VDVDAVAEVAAAKVDERQVKRSAEQDRQRVNETFAGEFKAVHDHPGAFAVAQAHFTVLRQQEANRGRPLEELAREAGQEALKRYPELRAPDEQPTPEKPRTPTPADALQGRRELKKRTVVRQPTVTARAPAPTAPVFPSGKDYVAQLRRNAGLPPTP
jgi:hypothetical protein